MNITPQKTSTPRYPLLRAGLLGLAASALSSCNCSECNGNGYLQLLGGSPSLRTEDSPATAGERLVPCPECDTTGRLWGFGSTRAKEGVDRSSLNTIRMN